MLRHRGEEGGTTRPSLRRWRGLLGDTHLLLLVGESEGPLGRKGLRWTPGKEGAECAGGGDRKEGMEWQEER